jgi:hypothetical protein
MVRFSWALIPRPGKPYEYQRRVEAGGEAQSSSRTNGEDGMICRLENTEIANP